MPIPSLYLDTSVPGGYFDDELKQSTQVLWRQMKEGKWRLVSSDVTTQEIEGAPPNVRELFADTFTPAMLLEVTLEMEELSTAYLEQGIITRKYQDDALHVAVCTVARVDFLMSWNFKHLVNVQREAGFNGVDLLQGYPPVRIVNPLEIIYENSDEDL